MYHNDPSVDVSVVIPCEDSIYNNVEIPIFLISNADGEVLRKRIQENNDVLLSVDIDIPGKQTEVIESDYWINPTSLKCYQFLLEF